MADAFHVVPPDRRLAQLQHLAGRVVHELYAALRIDNDDPFNHPGEDRRHASPVPRQVGKPAAELVHRVVQDPRDGSQLVVAVIETWGCEIAAPVPAGDVSDRTDPTANPPRQDEPDGCSADERKTKGRQRGHQDGPQLLADVGHGERHANERDVRVLHRHGDVQHAHLERVAVPLGPPNSHTPSRLYLGPGPVVLHPPDIVERLGRVAEHTTIGGDEGDAGAEELAEPIRFRVQLGNRIRCGRERADALSAQEIGGEPGFCDECALNPRIGLRLRRQREQEAGHGQRQDCRRQRRQKELGLEGSVPHDSELTTHNSGPRTQDTAFPPGGGSSSLYPNCLTVTSACSRGGSFSRSRLTCTSTVRVPPVYL